MRPLVVLIGRPLPMAMFVTGSPAGGLSYQAAIATLATAAWNDRTGAR